MDYGIIFIIILVIVIIIAIILIIYANRSNVTNILASFPSYRIQNNDDNTTNNYLGLRNCTTNNSVQNQKIPISGFDFWDPFASSGLNNIDSFGIWKIENIPPNNNIPIVTGSKVKLVNFVYNVQSSNFSLGYLEQADFWVNNKILLTPNDDISGGITFIYTLVGNNLFSLKAEFENRILPVVVDRSNNFLGMSININDSPTIFKLDFRQQ